MIVFMERIEMELELVQWVRFGDGNGVVLSI